MKEANRLYGMPNMGCMLGTAYQTLVIQLDSILREELKEVTVPEYLILRTLYFKDGIQQCEIGEILGKDKGQICRTVKIMTQKGLAKTEAVSHKCVKVYLTPKAEAMKAKVMDIAASRHRSLENLLGADAISIFSDCLKKIIES